MPIYYIVYKHPIHCIPESVLLPIVILSLICSNYFDLKNCSKSTCLRILLTFGLVSNERYFVKDKANCTGLYDLRKVSHFQNPIIIGFLIIIKTLSTL